MFSKRVVCILVFACLAVELVTACTPSSTSVSSGSSTAAPTSSTAASGSGRKRREANGASIVLHSNVKFGDSGRLLHQLQSAAANTDVDASKYSNAEHQVASDSNGNALVTLNLQGVSDCAGLRQDTQKIVKQVSDVTSVSVNCGGSSFTL